MGALTGPVLFRGTRVASGDVIHLRPRGPWRLLRRPFCAVVDARDRSIPYVVFCRGTQVMKAPLEEAFPARRFDAAVYRLPGIDKSRGAQVAARAAERPGEGVHHPAYDCGRRLEHPDDLVRDAYRAIGVEVEVVNGSPVRPLQEVRGDQDPPNTIIVPDPEGGGRPGDGGSWIHRGIRRSLPWQRRSRR